MPLTVQSMIGTSIPLAQVSMERRRGGRIGKHTYFPDDLRFDLVLMAFEYYLFIIENCRTQAQSILIERNMS